jgi:hypothetical protein
LAANTVKKLSISDSDIIDANLTFLDKCNIIDRTTNEKLFLEVDYRSLFREYEKDLLESLNEV